MYGFRRDPFGPDPFGPDYQRMMNPEPYLDTMQFTQNPNTPMTPPPMGIAEVGGVDSAPYMGYMMGKGGASGGAPAANYAAALAKAIPNEKEQISLPGVGKAAQGAEMKFIIPYAEQIAALNELRRMRR